MKPYVCDQRTMLNILDEAYESACEAGSRLMRNYERKILRKNLQTITITEKDMVRLKRKLERVGTGMQEFEAHFVGTRFQEFAQHCYLLQPEHLFDVNGSTSVFKLTAPLDEKLEGFFALADSLPHEDEKFKLILKHAVRNAPANIRFLVNTLAEQRGWGRIVKHVPLKTLIDRAIEDKLTIPEYSASLYENGHQWVYHHRFMADVMERMGTDTYLDLFMELNKKEYVISYMSPDNIVKEDISVELDRCFRAVQAADGFYDFRDKATTDAILAMVRLSDVTFLEKIARIVEHPEPEGIEPNITATIDLLADKQLELSPDVYYTGLSTATMAKLVKGGCVVSIRDIIAHLAGQKSLPRMPLVISRSKVKGQPGHKVLVELAQKLGVPIIFTGHDVYNWHPSIRLNNLTVEVIGAKQTDLTVCGGRTSIFESTSSHDVIQFTLGDQ